MHIFDIEAVDAKIGDTFWSPIDVAHINDWVVRVAAFKGEYHWHHHDDDELFWVCKGEIVIDTEKGPIQLKAGQGTVIPKGVKHKPSAKERALVAMMEPFRLQS